MSQHEPVWEMAEAFGRDVCETPIQLQLFVTTRCNRCCPWCIEKYNMAWPFVPDDERFLQSLSLVFDELNQKHLGYNVVMTGGEPTENEGLSLKVIEQCARKMPAVTDCVRRPKGIKTRQYKVGLNTNGDRDSKLYRCTRFDYIDVDFIDKMYPADKFSSARPVRLQTVYRSSVFPNGPASVVGFVTEALDAGYDSVVFRECWGEHGDRCPILGVEREVAKNRDFQFLEYRSNQYDLWVKYSYRGHDVYFKRQDLGMQHLYERANQGKIVSLVVWPDGRVTKSWEHEDVILRIEEKQE